MQILFILATVLGLIVAIFAVQNATPVTVRFLHWRLDSSVAVVTVLAVGTGAIIAWLLSLTSRLMRWRRRSRRFPRPRPLRPRPSRRGADVTAAGTPQPPAGELHRLRAAVDAGELSDVAELAAAHDDMMMVLPWTTCGDGARRRHLRGLRLRVDPAVASGVLVTNPGRLPRLPLVPGPGCALAAVFAVASRGW